MKNKVKIFVLAMSLVLLVATLAACEIGGGDTTTTKGEEATTTAATPDASTTTANDKKDIKVSFSDKRSVKYTGGSLATSMKVTHSALNVSYVYKKGGVEIEAKDIVNVGEYEVTATFAFKKPEYGTQYNLPEPITAVFTVVPATLEAGDYQLTDKTAYYYPECAYDITYNGKVPSGLEFSYTIRKVKEANGNTADITLDAGAKANAAGEYEVTLHFTDKGGNYVPESLVPQKATLKIIECPNQVLRYTPDMDGKVDAAYLNSAYFKTVSVDSTPEAIAEAVKRADEHTIVLATYAGQTGSTAGRFGAEATIYYLWDDNYIYVCVKVKDETKFPRSDAYLAQPNPWINDAIEFYYFFGGYDKPIPTGDTYPTYSAVTTDAKGRGNKATNKGAAISAVTRQQSAFYSDIECAWSETTDGYIIEYAFPNKQEVLVDENGVLGADGQYHCKEALKDKDGNVVTVKVGEFGYAALQLNDMVQEATGTIPGENKYGDPRKLDTITDAWKAYEEENASKVFYASNRMRTEVDRYMVFQFSATAATPAE